MADGDPRMSCPTLKSPPTVSTFRATLYRKLTALFCRLPLPTLFYRPEAAHLGDLLRLLVRPGVVGHSTPWRLPAQDLLPLVFKDQAWRPNM